MLLVTDVVRWFVDVVNDVVCAANDSIVTMHAVVRMVSFFFSAGDVEEKGPCVVMRSESLQCDSDLKMVQGVNTREFLNAHLFSISWFYVDMEFPQELVIFQSKVSILNLSSGLLWFVWLSL